MHHVDSREAYDRLVEDLARHYPDVPGSDLTSAILADPEDHASWDGTVDRNGTGPIETSTETYDEPVCPTSVLQHSDAGLEDPYWNLKSDIDTAQLEYE